MSDNRLRVSVVTPTHNRPHSLLRLLRALRDGTFPSANFEAVVVADGCHDDTVARARAEPLPFSLTVLEQNPGRGAAAARNLGAGHARGELIVFLDDDIEPEAELLAAHWREYEKATEPTVVIGPPLPVRAKYPGLHAIAAWGWWEQQFEAMRKPGHRFAYHEVFSGNLSMPRSLFLDVGGFDVEFNSCRDDSELGLRCMRRGARIVFAPEARAWHHELRDSAALIRRKQAEGVADVRLARLYPELWRSLRLSHPEQKPWSALGIVRRLAVDVPVLGRALARAAQRMLPLLEWVRFRTIWRQLQAGLMYFWYWHAAARAMGGRAGLATLDAEHRRASGEISLEEGAPFEIDLARGLAAAEAALDARRPAHAAVVWGPHYVGYVHAEPGAEALGGRHLREILAGDLAHPLTSVLATVAVSGTPAWQAASDPAVSIVIPAYNAAETLGEALDSVLRQSSPNWECIVIDDGSTDSTGAIAERYAARDARVRVIHQPNGGEGAARNTGLAEAQYEWLLFLDADDWITPDALRVLTQATLSDHTLDAVHGGWRRVARDGRCMDPEYCPYAGDLFAAFARNCVLLVHTVLVRRSLAQAVGEFRTTKTCADWDFWQRVARTGANFGTVRHVVAHYRLRVDSASTLTANLWSDGLGVIAQGHTVDSRVAVTQHHDGMPGEQLSEARYEYACWIAGLVIGQGGNAMTLLDDLSGERAPGLNPEAAAQAILRTVTVVTARTHEAWDELWPVSLARIEAFFNAVERQTGAKRFKMRAMRALECLTLNYSTAPRPFTRNGTLAFEWDVTSPLPTIAAPEGVERGHCVVLVEGSRLGTVSVPISPDAESNKRALAQEVATRFAWPLIRWFLHGKHGPYRDLVFVREPGGLTVLRGQVALATGMADADAVNESTLHDRIGWTLFLQEIWARPDLGPDEFYESDAGDEAGSTRQVHGGRLTFDICDELPSLDVMPRSETLEVDVRIGGTSFGMVRLSGEPRHVSAAQLRVAITVQSAFELCRAAVRELVVGAPRDAQGSLRTRLVRRQATAVDRSTARMFPQLPNELPYVSEPGVTYDRHYFESVFSRARDPWSYVTPYEQFKYAQTLAQLPDGRIPRALELACAEGTFTRLLAARVEELLATDISAVALERARVACAQLPNVRFQQLDFVVNPIPGEFDLIVCSEVLYYLPSEHEVAQVAAKLRDALTRGGRLVLAHTSAAADDPDEVGLQDVPFGGKRIGEVIGSVPGLRFCREVQTELYRIQIFERPYESAVAARPNGKPECIELAPHVAPVAYLQPHVRRLGRASATAAAHARTNQRMPILMYHDVAPTSESGLQPWRYRLTPNAFACQLEYMRNAGFRCATLAEWTAAMHYRRRLPERSVILTFDDAYRSFVKYALPLLQQYGFSAIIFVPCAYVGGENVWDLGVTQQVPLLNWDEIRALAAQGIEFGAHSMTHPPMTGLSTADVLREAGESREMLQRELGKPVTAFAYPYGDNDAVVQQLVARCGYSIALTTRFECANFHDLPMDVPRIEVTPYDNLTTFIRNLGA